MNASAGRVVAQVQDQLRALWSSGSPDQALTSRSCTMNLVVVAATPDLAIQWVPIVDDVVKSMPARAIVVGLDPDGSDAIEATVGAVCSPSQSGSTAICSERITLMARGALCARLPSCVEAMCATDVPTTLVWLARVHGGDPTFGPLAREASRIVLDASQSSLGSLAHVVRWARERPVDERPGVADLAWTRLSQWQQLCARMFDSSAGRDLAQHVTSVHISQASDDGASVGPEGALLLGWLATRLGWQATSLAGRLRLLRPDGGHLLAHLRAQPSSTGARGSLLGLEIEASVGETALTGQIARDTERADEITWRVALKAGGDVQHMERHTRLLARKPDRLLDRTLHRRRYDDALASAAIWADELRGEELVCGSVDASAVQR